MRAFGICGSQAAGIIEYLADGSWTKRLHPGWAAHGGVIAALLAQSGFTGPETVFEGEHGFYRAFAGEVEPERLDGLLASLGRVWELDQLTFKPYPWARSPSPTWTARCGCARRAACGPRTSPRSGKHAPQNGYAAKFSLPFLLAVILTRGRASLAEFEDDVVRDQAVLAVASRVGYELDPTIDYPRQFVGHLRVRLRDGRVVEEWQDHPRGGPDSPMGRDEIEAKFRGNASLAISDNAASRVIGHVRSLAPERSLDTLMRSLTRGGAGS